MRALLALAMLVTIGSPAAAQETPVLVRTQVDRLQMTIGDQVLFTLFVDLAPGYTLQDPGVPRRIGDFEVVETLTSLQTRSPNGATRVQLRFLVTAFELGPHALPEVIVGYRGPDGAAGQARSSGAHLIDVLSVVQPGEDTSDVKPLKPPLALPEGTVAQLQTWIPFVALALALGGLVALALRLRKRAQVIAYEPVQGPARRALEELEAIVAQRLPESGKTREHYELVSDTLRRYAAERFGLVAHARTARELRRDLERSGADSAQIQAISDALHDAESVRFEEQVVYPARAQKTMRDLLDSMRRSVAVEEYELIESGASA